MSFTKFKRGLLVRCYFGTEHRDGVVEHETPEGKVHVRLSPGWVHIADGLEVQRLQLNEDEHRKVRASVFGALAA